MTTRTRCPNSASGALNCSWALPGADLSAEELSVHVVPMQPDEFWCESCFLVYHRSCDVSSLDGTPICRIVFPAGESGVGDPDPHDYDAR